MQRKSFIIIFLIILLTSSSLNILLFIFSKRIYRQYKLFQIDPSSSLEYRSSNTTNAMKSSNKNRIILFGDSRIFQWNPLPEISGCEFINRGIPGETTSQAILRIDRDIIQLKPDIAIIQIGGNDCNAIGILPEMENYITTNCISNINIIIEKLQKKKIKVIILSIFPFGNVNLFRLPIWSERSRDAIDEVNSTLKKYNSSEIKFVNCDIIFKINNKMNTSYSHGMLHINRNGYLKLNEFLNSYILELMVHED